MLQNEWDDFQHLSYRVSAVLALITNSILVHLIVNHSPKSLGTYKYLMICICLFEVFYEALDLAASPDMYTQGSAFLVIVSDRKSPFPVSMLLGINLAYCACFGTSLAIFAVHFVYRYLVVIGHKEWIIKSTRNIVFWLVAPLSFGVVWVWTAWHFISPEPYLDRVLRKEIPHHYEFGVDDCSYVGVYFYPVNEKGKQFINWKAIHGMMIFVVMIVSLLPRATIQLTLQTASLSIMAYFGIKSYLTINSAVTKTAKSTKFRTLQSQLLLALILQTIIPLFLMHFPAGICFLIPFFESSREIMGRILTVSISLYPVIDPLPNMFLVKEYRKALLKKLRVVSEVQKIQSLFSWS